VFFDDVQQRGCAAKTGRRQGRAKEEPLKDSQREEKRICLYMSESCLILHFSG